MRTQTFLRFTLSLILLATATIAEAQRKRPDAYLVSTKGKVAIRSSQGKLKTAKAPAVLRPGDKIVTGRGGQALVAYEGGSKVTVWANSSLTVEDTSKGKLAVKLLKGRLDAWVHNLSGGVFRIKTPKAVASVRGSHVATALNPFGFPDFFCFEGDFFFEGPGGVEIPIPPGQRMKVTQTGPQQTRKIPNNIKPGTEPTVDVKEVKKKAEANSKGQNQGNKGDKKGKKGTGDKQGDATETLPKSNKPNTLANEKKLVDEKKASPAAP